MENSRHYLCQPADIVTIGLAAQAGETTSQLLDTLVL
jgi:hypothetical protein